MKRIIISTLLILFSLTQSYGFWMSNTTQIGSQSTVSILIGDWPQFNIWQPSPDDDYEEGDIVYWEGNYYVRTRRAPNLNWEPGSFLGWIIWERQ